MTTKCCCSKPASQAQGTKGHSRNQGMTWPFEVCNKEMLHTWRAQCVQTVVCVKELPRTVLFLLGPCGRQTAHAALDPWALFRVGAHVEVRSALLKEGRLTGETWMSCTRCEFARTISGPPQHGIGRCLWRASGPPAGNKLQQGLHNYRADLLS